jgi:hypothetical protein
MEAPVLKQFQRIPGVGKSIAKDLYLLGFRSIADLKDRDPEEMYDRLCRQAGEHVDRCMLYVFRCAVYYASTPERDPEKLKWWNWSDARLAESRMARLSRPLL